MVGDVAIPLTIVVIYGVHQIKLDEYVTDEHEVNKPAGATPIRLRVRERGGQREGVEREREREGEGRRKGGGRERHYACAHAMPKAGAWRWGRWRAC